MPIDPRIPLGVQPVQLPNPLELYGQISHIQAQKSQAVAARRAAEAEQALRDAVSIDPATHQPTIDFPKLIGHLGADKILAVQDAAARLATNMDQARVASMTADEKARTYLGGLGAIVRASGDDPRTFELAITAARRNGALPEKDAEQSFVFSRDPAFRKTVIDQALALAGPTKPGTLERVNTVDAEGREVTQFVEPVAGSSYLTPPPAAPRETTPAVGSFEDYVVRRFGPTPTAEQITQARQAYQQADDRPPQGPDPILTELRQMQLEAAKRAALTGGDWTPAQHARFTALHNAYERSPLVKASDRTLVLKDAIQQIRKDPGNAVNQMALAYGFIQIADTYQSAVREGELGNITALATRLQQLQIEANRIYTTGAFMPPGLAQQIATTSEQMIRAIEGGRQQKLREYASRAKVSGISDMWEQFVSGAGIGAPPATETSGGTPGAPTGPKVGERRMVNGQLAEWDGKGWKAVANAAR